MLGDKFPVNHSFSIATAHVECGGSPPLFAVPARRDVLQPLTMAADPARQGEGVSS
jgi:hypothetical protein